MDAGRGSGWSVIGRWLQPLPPPQKDVSYLQQWLENFVMSFERVIALPSLEPRRPEEVVSEIPVLPREVLQVLIQRLGQSVALIPREEGGGAGLGQALLLLKFFSIICRWVTPPRGHPDPPHGPLQPPLPIPVIPVPIPEQQDPGQPHGR
ncbi:PREDICTED: neurobeachin-like protein 2 [Lepidothrix coronata]|uniref:Neurobeachin-like protein 2 n=1 Tax=Lepidothrix coronata TaxID=321398 RepID=A0A6J0G6X2_9PASS|nr:PREDICTED: neurobeachin-like protein 2 [Lepidothrix coronata]